ncbi:MAG TPA: phosphotransferase [Mycobacteriales bacterium]
MRIRRLTGGFRNENLLLVTDNGHRYVLRRYRHGDRHAVEAALVRRLTGVVPVPEVIALDSGAATGEPLLLSRFCPGTMVADLLPGLPDGQAAGLGRAVGAVLAGIGAVTFAGSGFFDGADLVPVPGPALTADLPAFVEHCLATGAADVLTPAECQALSGLASRSAPLLAAVAGSAQLVHADYNTKNLLAELRDGRWVVTAVLDWEFAFSGDPLVDIGNLLRFDDELPVAFQTGVVDGFTEAGGKLLTNWRPISKALDLFSLSDLLTRPVDHPYFHRVVAACRRRIAAG